MKFFEFLFKKLNFLIILIASLIYLALYLLEVDVSYGSISFAIIHVVIITTILYSVFRLIFPLNKKEKQTTKQSKTTQEKTNKQTTTNKQQTNDNTLISNDGVTLYRVKQDDRYYFKEFSDRYELYIQTPSGLKYVKTDYKNNLEKKWLNFITMNII